jgi:hypothetical protein
MRTGVSIFWSPVKRYRDANRSARASIGLARGHSPQLRRQRRRHFRRAPSHLVLPRRRVIRRISSRILQPKMASASKAIPS